MIRRDGVDSPQLYLSLQHPVTPLSRGPRMPVDVAFFVRHSLGLVPAVAVEPCVEDEDVSIMEVYAVFDHVRGVDAQVSDITDVHDDPGAVELLQGDLVDGLASRNEVTGCVQVGSHVVGGHDVLGVDAVLGLSLDVLHLEGRVRGPEGSICV